MLNDMIAISSDFQTSVNIAYDLGNDEKIKKLIPTKASLELLEDIMLSTDNASTRRARILIGAYGKGKSHIVLTILSVLCQKDKGLHDSLLQSVKEYSANLYDYLKAYIKSDKRLLPVIITGNNSSLNQSFMVALHTALVNNNLMSALPETKFQAAINMIDRWEKEFPTTYTQLKSMLSLPVAEFIASLKEYDTAAYNTFENLYPELTSGSEFNPFSGFDVVELYEQVCAKLPSFGYNGLFVVYDEFSKYLESSITKASINDIKMLQDFAEKCNRSGAHQLHLLLISHKEIENYIDQLPKNKVDGWKGVSERFAHIVMHNDNSQIYDLISATIKKESVKWETYCKKNHDRFETLVSHCSSTHLFEEGSTADLSKIIYGCYPLHPTTAFILPRLSERVAQNERTMFTFLSGREKNTLYSILANSKSDFLMVTPDCLFDYFSAQLRNEPYTSDIRKNYVLAVTMLRSLAKDSLSAKIIKTIALIYCVEQFEKLAPTADCVFSIYQDAGYSFEEIRAALQDLETKQCMMYVKRSNAFLKLKESTGNDIPKAIADTVQKRLSAIKDAEILNNENIETYLYPTGYNDSHEMTRFFQFVFVSYEELQSVDNWESAILSHAADGLVVGIIPNGNADFDSVQCRVEQVSAAASRVIFIVPSEYERIHEALREIDAVALLRDSAQNDPQLFEEYDIVYQDLLEVLQRFISQYTHPELHAASYYNNGAKLSLYRKANLTHTLSLICERSFPNTPTINNETINKNELSTVAINSRTKLLQAILNNTAQANLGLNGTGQDVSFMRSTLVVPGLLKQNNGQSTICYESDDEKLNAVLSCIADFIESSKQGEKGFPELYDRLSGIEHGIGLRKGVIPIYLAVVLGQYEGHIIVRDQYSETRITADLLTRLNENPKGYFVSLEDWTDEKQAYIEKLSELYADYIIKEERQQGGYSYVLQAMNRWYLSLPKYVKELKNTYCGMNAKTPFTKVEKARQKFLSLLKQPGIGAQEVLFKRISACFGYDDFQPSVYDNIEATKAFFDTAKFSLEKRLIQDTRIILDKDNVSHKSLSSIAIDWCDCLSAKTKGHLFSNGAERLFAVLENATNDERLLVNRLAKALTDLRIDDWNDDMVRRYCERLKLYVETINEFEKDSAVAAPPEAMPVAASDEYSVIFVGESGTSQHKTFGREKCSRRAELLKDEIVATIEEMGQSITPQEKRQVLMDVLEKFC